MILYARGIEQLLDKFGNISARIESEINQVVSIAVRDIHERALDEHKWISRTGETERDGIKRSVEGLVGTVELATNVAVYLHEGTKAHEIMPRNKMALRFPLAGNFVFSRRVYHPGTAKDPFLYNAAEYLEAEIISRFDKAICDLTGG